MFVTMNPCMKDLYETPEGNNIKVVNNTKNTIFTNILGPAHKKLVHSKQNTLC